MKRELKAKLKLRHLVKLPDKGLLPVPDIPLLNRLSWGGIQKGNSHTESIIMKYTIKFNYFLVYNSQEKSQTHKILKKVY